MSDFIEKACASRRKMIEQTISEAERFIGRAREAALACTPDGEWVGGPKMAAAKRASMDLTRALANLRKPNQ